jgi:hypothetical protein
VGWGMFLKTPSSPHSRLPTTSWWWSRECGDDGVFIAELRSALFLLIVNIYVYINIKKILFFIFLRV